MRLTRAILNLIASAAVLLVAVPAYSGQKGGFSVFRTVSCEMLLRSDLQNLSTQGLSQLEVLQKTRELAPDQHLFERLRKLEARAENIHLNNQTVIYEIRGKNIRKAVDRMWETAEKVHPEYEFVRKELMSKRRTQVVNAVEKMQMAVVGFIGIATVVNIQSSPIMETALNALLVGVNGYWMKQAWSQDKKRFDHSHMELWGRMINLQPDDFIMQSVQLEMPTEFHRFLMEGENIWVSARVARAEAVRKLDDSYLSQMVRDITPSEKKHQQERNQRLKGETEVDVEISHIGYFDSEKNEPVWLIVYTATKKPLSR